MDLSVRLTWPSCWKPVFEIHFRRQKPASAEPMIHFRLVIKQNQHFSKFLVSPILSTSGRERGGDVATRGGGWETGSVGGPGEHVRDELIRHFSSCLSSFISSCLILFQSAARLQPPPALPKKAELEQMSGERPGRSTAAVGSRPGTCRQTHAVKERRDELLPELLVLPASPRPRHPCPITGLRQSLYITYCI